MNYNEWIMAVIEDDLGLSESELAQLEDIIEGSEE